MIAELSATQRNEEGIVSLGTRNGIELAILKRTEKSLGKIIAKPDSTDLIDGVRIEPLRIYPDDCGFFTEIARLGRELATGMVPDSAPTSASQSKCIVYLLARVLTGPC